MKLFYEVTPDKQLQVLQSLLWYNDHIKACFTISPADNPVALLWYKLDIATSNRTEHLYYHSSKGIHAEIDKGTYYRVTELSMYGKPDKIIALMTLTNVKDSSDTIGFWGIDMPKK